MRQREVENLRRDGEIDRLQQELNKIKQRPDFSPARHPEAAVIQRQLDQLRNDQQMRRLQDQQQLNRSRSEADPVRERAQIDDLRFRPRIQSLQDQSRRNQVEQDLNRLRQPHPIHRTAPHILGPSLRR